MEFMLQVPMALESWATEKQEVQKTFPPPSSALPRQRSGGRLMQEIPSHVELNSISRGYAGVSHLRLLLLYHFESCQKLCAKALHFSQPNKVSSVFGTHNYIQKTQPAGKNSRGQLGNGQTESVDVPTAVNADLASSWSTIVTGGSHACGIARLEDEVLCWGTFHGISWDSSSLFFSPFLFHTPCRCE